MIVTIPSFSVRRVNYQKPTSSLKSCGEYRRDDIGTEHSRIDESTPSVSESQEECREEIVDSEKTMLNRGHPRIFSKKCLFLRT